MQSHIDPRPAGSQPVARNLAEIARNWNKRLHYFTGLFLFFFIWLFSLTGLLLNHPQWTFAEFWANRRQSQEELPIVPPAGGNDLAQARDLMRQLRISGEIERTAARANANQLDFRVSRPGHLLEVKADFDRRQAKVARTELNIWGVTHILHTFTGVRIDDQRNQRDWVLTSVWAFAMDAVAIGLIFMILSSLYMWYDLRQKRVSGAIILLLGCVICALFSVGLKWLY